jgi:hypothetical protein
MKVILYSKLVPRGVTRDSDVMPAWIMEAIETSGVYRGDCPCCDRRIVVRMAGERFNMTAGDEHFLLHEEADE